MKSMFEISIYNFLNIWFFKCNFIMYEIEQKFKL